LTLRADQIPIHLDRYWTSGLKDLWIPLHVKRLRNVTAGGSSIAPRWSDLAASQE
jgi:hypothetical protein